MRISDWSSDVCSSDLLAGVDHQLEDAVDQDQSQEAEAERQQHVRLCQVDAVEQAHGMAEHRLAEGQVEREEWLRRPRLVEALALDTFVDDLLRKVQREVVERQGSQNDQQDGHLLAPAVTPDIFKDVRFHASSSRAAAAAPDSGGCRAPCSPDRKSTRLTSSH